MNRFSETVMENFLSPQNRGTLEEPSGVGVVGQPGRGPFLVIAVRVESGRVTQARFQCHGCGATIACRSVLTQQVLGQTPEECCTLSVEALLDALGGLPVDKEHCAHQAIAALQTALQNAEMTGCPR